MGFLNRVLRRGNGHEKWLEANPGKQPMGSAAPATSADEQQRIRDTMEGELGEQRAKRDEA